MKRIVIYSHDAYGLGNIRRMLAIATELAGSLERASVLVVSGSAMVQGFRVAPQIDYIKLPCVTRTVREGYSTRSLGLDARDTFELRANLLLAVVADFRPDVILVDKKPFGMENELEAAVVYAKSSLPHTSIVLVLRDILDRPDATIRSWRTGHYADAIDRFYDRVLVLGSPSVFDVREEYALPASVAWKLRYCGYVRKAPGCHSRQEIRRRFDVDPRAKLVLVTPGGGQDGARVVDTYVSALPFVHARGDVTSVIVTGPEMAAADRERIKTIIASRPRVHVLEFSDDMMSCIDAADLVVCMGGYNTICEVATLRKRAIVVPRVRPVEEQLIRARRLAALGVVSMIHPDSITAEALGSAVLHELGARSQTAPATLDFDALPRVTAHITALLHAADLAGVPGTHPGTMVSIGSPFEPAVA